MIERKWWGKYWKELLDRIRGNRYSEKVLYRQFFDLYATSVDYDPDKGDLMKEATSYLTRIYFGQRATRMI